MKIIYFILAFVVFSFVILQNMAWDANRTHLKIEYIAPVQKIEAVHAKTARDDLSELFINHEKADIDAEKALAEFNKSRHVENLQTKKQRVQAYNRLFAKE